MLTHDSFKPLYFQLKEILHDKIESEELKEGDMIPSENELQQSTVSVVPRSERQSNSLFTKV